MGRFEINAGLAISIAHEIVRATTETELFIAMRKAAGTLRQNVALRAYVTGIHGKSLRLAADLGCETIAVDQDSVENWLLHDGPVPDFSDELSSNRLSTCSKIIDDDGMLLGGLILSFDDSVNDELSRDVNEKMVFNLTALGARTLGTLHKRRLSSMVLEALEQSEEAIVFYGEEEEGVIFSNEAYHRVFPHYPDRSGIAGKTHLELYRMDLEAGVISDPVALNAPDVYLEQRKQLESQLVESQRETQKIGDKTYIYTRTRSASGAIMSRRIDISEQAVAEAKLRENERQLRTLVYRDSLTGLFNRAYFLEFIETCSEQLASGHLKGVTVFWVDLNGFKMVNDNYGHDFGDYALRTIGRRLKRGILESDAVVRYGGDEFVVLFNRTLNEHEIEIIANRILTIVDAEVSYNDVCFRIGASVGIALSEGKSTNLKALLGDADLAMYEAKRLRESAYRIFNPAMRVQLIERYELLEDIRAAFENDGFELYFQPQFNLQTGELVGFEALSRWNHPRRGFIPPDVFIPIMEENNLIEELGRWVLKTACEEARKWPRHLFVAVNVSALQLRNPNFAIALGKCLFQSGLRPGQLELEITESVMLEGDQEERNQIESWKMLGVDIALDDVGKGYSSLSYLSEFPFDKIKIDRGFLGALETRRQDAAPCVILRAIVELGRSLGKTVIAEGVETPEQLEYLNSIACEQAQGYFLGKPMPADQVSDFICQATSDQKAAINS
ncbi:GGDEF and EAL domain-containing protein [uncultured Cohaesibacter sp.]|uniref:putative bifunctional diguanylate cyclase/phosphodiesterase n=1 Tax=uncultured Cohaesibacter sp. TaxID=1002546 RepID=UPI00292FA141|nr:GGDEF and EAL domain-containing protein [uncultured Cohaesibacter sp.]